MIRFLPARRSLENPLNRRFPHSLKFYSYYDTIILMYRRLADPKPLGRLPHSGIVVYDVIGDCYSPFFDIFLHGSTPENVFYIILKGVGIYARARNFASSSLIFSTFFPDGQAGSNSHSSQISNSFFATASPITKAPNVMICASLLLIALSAA